MVDSLFRENGNRKKQNELRIGPYKVMEKLSNSIYRGKIGHKNVRKLVSVLQMEKNKN